MKGVAIKDRKKQRENRRLHGDKPYPRAERGVESRRDPTADMAIYLADHSASKKDKPNPQGR